MIKLGETYKNKCGRDVRIICVDKRGDFPVVGIVSSNQCGEEEVMTYTSEGTHWVEEGSDYDLVLPEDFRTYKIDEPVMVRDNDNEVWVRRYFAGVKDDKPCAWVGGTTAWTNDDPKNITLWSQCRRPTKEELGEVK